MIAMMQIRRGRSIFMDEMGAFYIDCMIRLEGSLFFFIESLSRNIYKFSQSS